MWPKLPMHLSRRALWLPAFPRPPPLMFPRAGRARPSIFYIERNFIMKKHFPKIIAVTLGVAALAVSVPVSAFAKSSKPLS